MFCKYCGKQIAEDSIFCKFCGRKQDNGESIYSDQPTADYTRMNKKSHDFLSSIFKWYKKLSKKQKIVFYVFAAWFLIHLFLLTLGEGVNGFFPFAVVHNNIYYSNFYAPCYDISEFVFYVVLLPFLIFIIYKFIKTKQVKHSRKKTN